jgi:hypothetical protein
MTKTLVATRQVSSAAAGGFVKNVIGLQIHPANSEYGVQPPSITTGCLLPSRLGFNHLYYFH